MEQPSGERVQAQRHQPWVTGTVVVGTVDRDQTEGEIEAMDNVYEQVNYRYAYAVSLFTGAKEILKDRANSEAPYVISAYLLIGFSIENAFASFLIAVHHRPPGDYKSHKLEKAMEACGKYGLAFDDETVSFIKKIGPYHSAFVFRYPERLTLITLDAPRGIWLTFRLICDVETSLKMRGINPVAAIETPML